MADLIKALPGIKLPVGEVTKSLATMLDADPNSGQSVFRASQMNLVLHFGMNVAVEEARECFDAAIRFSQRYPCRIIVLCPYANEPEPGDAMSAKLFSQCYIGESKREMCYCEALILGYQSEDYGYLANQVSTWLEGDLPTYHWLHRVPAERVAHYRDNLLSRVKRIVFDGSIETGGYAEIEWPENVRVRDLASARLLPVRQSIGQFLSGYEVDAILDGLESVSVTSVDGFSGEKLHLLAWVKDCLNDAAARVDRDLAAVTFKSHGCAGDDAGCGLHLEFQYSEPKFFRWALNDGSPLGEIEADLGQSRELVPTRVKLLEPEFALAEAFFFD